MFKYDVSTTGHAPSSDEDLSTVEDLQIRDSDRSDSDGNQERVSAAGDSLDLGGYLF